MSRGPRTSHRLDTNHHEIVSAFERAGCDVLSLTELGGGCADLLVHRRGRLTLIEVKTAKGKIRPDQVTFAQRWPVTVVRSVADVEMWLARWNRQDIIAAVMR